MRARAVVAFAASAAVLAAGAYVLARPRVLARSDDGSVAILEATWATTMPLRTPIHPRIPWFRTTQNVSFDAVFEGRPILALVVQGGPTDAVRIEGSCGCRFGLSEMIHAVRGNSVVVSETLPRRDADLRVRFGDDGPLLVIGNPAPLAPPATGPEGEELPVSVRAGAETWILTQRPSAPGELAVQAVGADGSGFPWRHHGARMSDASGNVTHRWADDRATREHRFHLPARTGLWNLCVHEPWWELTVNPEGREPVTFRFRPPDTGR